MAAERDRVLKRVTEILNLCDPGTYSAAISSRNKTRNADAIADMVDEAGMMILNAIAERPNEFRYLFVTDNTVTRSGELLESTHVGPLVSVKIRAWQNGPIREGRRLDYRKINSYRENPNQVYDAINHDAKGSRLAGYYDLWEDRFFFTGKSAIIEYARPPIRRDITERDTVPDILENTWVRLGVGGAEKVGTGGYETGVIRSYGSQGQADLEAFRAGTRQFSEVDDPEPTSAAH